MSNIHYAFDGTVEPTPRETARRCLLEIYGEAKNDETMETPKAHKPAHKKPNRKDEIAEVQHV